MCERVQVQVDRVTCGSILQTQQLCGCSDGSCVRRSCAAGDLPACAGVDVSWTPPWVSNTLSKGHRGIPCRASGLVQIAEARFERSPVWKGASINRNTRVLQVSILRPGIA